MTGDIASKDAAANWALEQLPTECKQIVMAARDGYQGLEALDLAKYPKEREALLHYIRSRVIATLKQIN